MTNKRWALSLIFNPFNFHVPKIQHINNFKDFNGRTIVSRNFLIGPFSFGISWRYEDEYDI